MSLWAQGSGGLWVLLAAPSVAVFIPTDSSPALMTPCTPVSCRQRSTSLRCWMFPLANTGMFTACLRRNTASVKLFQFSPLTDESSTSFWEQWLTHTKWERAKSAAHLTALMCSQLAIPVLAPFCSLVLPCTVKSCKKINKQLKLCKKPYIFWEMYNQYTYSLIKPDIQLSPTSGHSGPSFPSHCTHGSYMWRARRAFHWLTSLETQHTNVCEMATSAIVLIKPFSGCLFYQHPEFKLTHFLQQLPLILEESPIMSLGEKKQTQISILDLHAKCL